jgi:methylmalonyl-CoA/ethylmalonyl-CoA epimerase
MTGALTDLRFHHLGLAVRQDKETLLMLEALGYKPGERILDKLQNCYVRLCTCPDKPAVEIVQPGDEGKSPVDAMISKYNELVYHSCYETPDLSETLKSIETAGLRCMTLVERRPAILFGGRHVSFYRIPGFGIVELLERT